MESICNRIYKFEDLKLYNFFDVVNNFSLYYDLNLGEIENYLVNVEILNWEVICESLRKRGINNIESKVMTYEVYKKSLDNLMKKGLELVEIIRYLCDVNNIVNRNDIYENKLEDANIYHYGCILTGNGINKILIVLYHLINEVNNFKNKINLIDTYVGYGSDSFMISYDEEQIYPNRSLVVYDDEWSKNLLDKTSFIVKRKVRDKIEN